MNELKTLTDINDDIGDSVYRFNPKQEAIQWIKYLENSKLCVDDLASTGLQCVIDWIKLFFNIMEEELK